jgi:hypothetical protein
MDVDQRHPIAQGEVVVVNDSSASALTDIITPGERMRKLKDSSL